MDKVTVTQADREAAASAAVGGQSDKREAILNGEYDQSEAVKAFAAHRIEATRQAEEQIKLLRGLVEEAFLEGYALGGTPRDANRSWEQSDSRQALEATNG